MSEEKAKRHLHLGDSWMKNGAYEQAFSFYNSSLGNYEKVQNLRGQKTALGRMQIAAKHWGNDEMVQNCLKWRGEVCAELRVKNEITKPKLSKEVNAFLGEFGVEVEAVDLSRVPWESIIKQWRKSAAAQGLPDFDLDGRSDEEAIEHRKSLQTEHPQEDLLKQLLTEIEAAAAKINEAPGAPVISAIFPWAGSNARVATLASGFAIVIDAGWFSLLQDVFGIYIASTPMVLIDATTGKKTHELPPEMTMEDATSLLAAAALRYLRVVNQPSSTPFLGAARGMKQDDLTLHTLRFILAHEYGHLLAEHVGDFGPANEVVPFKLKGWVYFANDETTLTEDQMRAKSIEETRSRDREILADQFGFDLCLANIVPVEDNDMQGAIELSLRLSGIFAFFDLSSFVDTLMMDAGSPGPGEMGMTHPAIAERQKIIKSWVKHLGAEPALGHVNEFSEWLASVSTEGRRLVSAEISEHRKRTTS